MLFFLFFSFFFFLFASWIGDDMDLNFDLGLDMILSQVDEEDLMDADTTEALRKDH